MLKALKHLAPVAALYVLGTGAGSLVYALFFSVFFGVNEKSSNFISGVVFGLSIMICFAICVSLYSNYVTIALTMGATRKALFGGIQVTKVLVAVGFFGVIALSDVFMPLIFKTEPVYDTNSLLLLAALCVFFSTMGESIGVVCTRFGKIGMYIYIGVCVLFGGAAGASAVIGSNGDLDGIILFVANLPAGVILAAVIVLALVVTIINWMMFKKSTVQGV